MWEGRFKKKICSKTERTEIKFEKNEAKRVTGFRFLGGGADLVQGLSVFQRLCTLT